MYLASDCTCAMSALGNLHCSKLPIEQGSVPAVFIAKEFSLPECGLRLRSKNPEVWALCRRSLRMS
jgi:hypothetical protein